VLRGWFLLLGTVRRTSLYAGWGDNPIAWVERCDVRVARNSFLIPSPVDEDHDLFYGTLAV
jgi:hypothetical protein